ncbi:MAG: DUF2953 domain-containing protein [Eubacteriales bacterium]|nr:DUF2953 domain-containing protein [Eubacteriales bacterium]
MTAVLMILKIIGILLLFLFILVLSLLFLVLFVPVCYRAEGSRFEETRGSARVSWFFRLLWVKAVYEREGPALEVRLAGIRVYPRTKKKEPSGTPEPPEKTQTEGEPKVSGAEDADKIEEPDKEAEPDKTAEPDRTAEPGRTEKKRRSRPHRLLRLRERLTGFWRRAGEALRRLSACRQLWEREETKRTVRLVWRQAGRLLRHIRPRRAELSGVVGTGDPASTGQLMALQGLLYPLLRGRVLLEPDFERKCLEGEFKIRGHIRLCVPAWCALRILASRDARRFVVMIRRKMGTQGGV